MTKDKNEMPDVYRLANEHVWQDGDGQSTALGVRTRVRVENAIQNLTTNEKE